jgi:hypothetical protein
MIDYNLIPAINHSELVRFIECNSAKKYKYYSQHDLWGKTTPKLIGTLVHLKVFKPLEYEKRVVTTPNLPGGMFPNFVSNYIKACKNLNLDYREYDNDVLKVCYANAGYKVGFDSALITLKQESISEYIEKHLNSEKDTILVSIEEETEVTNIYNALVADTDTFNFLNQEKQVEEVFTEHTLVTKIIVNNNEIEVKCVIDKYIVNHESKTIKLLDLKTIDDINNIRYSVYKYGNDTQQAFYTKILESEYPGYRVEFSALVFIEKKSPYFTVCVTLSEDTLFRAFEKIKYKLIEFNERRQMNKWDGLSSLII